MAIGSTAEVAEKSPKFQCNLGATLYASRWLFQHHFPSHVLLYAPDRTGMPILVKPRIYEILTLFQGGKTVSDAIESACERDSSFSFGTVFNIVNLFVERGFLRDEEDPTSFAAEGWHQEAPSYKSMNIWLHINNNCNLACAYCFVEHTREKMELDVLSETVERIGKTVRKHGVEDVVVKFAGGEPTLSIDRMEEFYEKLTEELDGVDVTIRWAMLTNGTNITDRLLKFVEKSNATISISLDGYGEYHDIYRVYRKPSLPVVDDDTPEKGSWDVIEANIEKLLDLGIVPYINGTISNESRDGLLDLAKWVYGNRMTGTMHVVRNLGTSWETAHDRRADYEQYCSDMAGSFEDMFSELESDKYKMPLPQAMEICELYFDEPAPDICCGIGANHLVIKHDGSLASCPMTVHEKTVYPIEDLFEASKKTFPITPAERGDDGVCLSCQWYKVCANACPVNNERLNGHAFTRSPLCSFWKYVIPRYLVFYGRKLLQAGRGKEIVATDQEHSGEVPVTCS